MNDEALKLVTDTKQNLITRFEILHINYYLDSQKFFEENPGKGFIPFNEYALKHWDSVDMNYFKYF